MGEASATPRINVIVIDDSAVVRQAITATLSRDRSINVIAAVADPIFAMQRMRMQWPDVVVLDIEMPRMDGLTFLKQVMQSQPMPVILISSLAQSSVDIALEALRHGAVDVLAKPCPLPAKPRPPRLKPMKSGVLRRIPRACGARWEPGSGFDSPLHPDGRRAETSSGMESRWTLPTANRRKMSCAPAGPRLKPP